MPTEFKVSETATLLALSLFSGLCASSEVTIPSGATLSLPSAATLQLGCADLNAGGSTLLNAGQIQQAGNVSITASGTLDAGSGSLQVGGNWTNQGAFVAGSSTVSFVDGCAATSARITGGTTFNNLALSSATARTFIIESGPFTTVNGTLAINGTPAAPVTLAPSSGTLAYIALGSSAVYTGRDASIPASVQIGASDAPNLPGAPLALQATAGNATISLRWSAPGTGGAVTGYVATSTPSGHGCAVTAPDTRCTVTGLTNGVAYTFTVVASNPTGYGPESLPSQAVTPTENGQWPPTEPLNAMAQAGNGQASLSWDTPVSGGAPVSYTATSIPGNRSCTALAPLTTCTVTGLTNGQPYTFEVVASNLYGSSVPSTPTRPVISFDPSTTPPTEPLRALAEAGNAEAVLSWTAPSSGGLPETYTATSTPGNLSCIALAPLTSCTVAGLTNGQSYTFQVIATNRYGDSPPSTATNPVVPSDQNPVDGACGPANAVATLVAPAPERLCRTGSASPVAATAGYFSWSCSSVGAGVQANCVAPGALTETESSRVTLEVPGCTIADAALSPAEGQPPAGVQFPYGAVNFTAHACPEARITPRLTYSSALDDMTFWADISDTWVVESNAPLAGYTANLSLIDNAQFDANPAVGVIGSHTGPATRNDKRAQRLLYLSENRQTIKSGKSVRLVVRGGQGRGKLRFSVKSTGGVTCTLKGRQLRASSTYSGACTVRAIKPGDSKFNATSSNPTTINVIGPANPVP